MYVASCPNCGHPSPVSLQRTDITSCPACGFSGALPPEIQARLRSAVAMLKGVDVRQRQLSGQQRSILGSGCGFTVILAAVVVFFMLPALGWAAISLVKAFEGDTFGDKVGFSVLGLSPLAVLLMGAAVSYLLLRRVRQRLSRACAAAPPFEGGSAARCRVCSADLVSTGGAIVRCEFCEADNVVESDVVRHAAHAQHQVLEGFEQIVVDSGRQLHSAAKWGMFAIVFSLVSAPFFAFVFAMVVYGSMTCVEQPANFEIRYALVETPSGRCLALIDELDNGRFSLSYGVEPPPGVENPESRENLDGLEIVTARSIIGRQVTSFYFSEATTGRVEAVTGDLTGGNNYTRLGGWNLPVEGLCLVEQD